MHHHPPPTTATTTTTGAAITTRYILLATTLFFFLLILSFTISPSSSPTTTKPHPSLFPHHNRNLFHNPNTTQKQNTPAATPPLPPTPPSIAYLLSGSANDSDRILRLLYSIYHPRNQYLLNLDRAAPQSDRDTLALRIQSEPVFRAAQNVHVIGKADYVSPIGPSSLSSTLHGASVLLRITANWDWFINLSANDYPLVTQDGIFISVFPYAYLVRYLFIILLFLCVSVIWMLGFLWHFVIMVSIVLLICCVYCVCVWYVKCACVCT